MSTSQGGSRKQASGTRGRPSNNSRPAIPTCWSSSLAALKQASYGLLQMSFQKRSNTTDKPGMIPLSTTPKRGSSTQSLNHLLNFTLPPRQTQQTLPRRNRRTNGSSLVWNKERECTTIRGQRHHLIIPLCRVCQRAVPVCYESNWRLHCAFCRPGHVCFR